MDAAEYHFWLQIEKLVGPVPENIKLLLQFSCFCNSSIADLDDELIDQIEQEARTIPTVLRIATNEKLIKKYFGVYCHTPNEFRFRSGERRMLKNISVAVRKKGLDSFIQSLRTIQHHTEARPAVSVMLQNYDPQTLRQMLREKVLNALNNNHAEILPDYLKVIQDNLDIQIVNEQGTPDAYVFCPLCSTKAKLSKDRTGSIIVSNYTLHVRKYHGFGPLSQGVKRKVDEYGMSEYIPEHMLDQIIKEEPDSRGYEQGASTPYYPI
ncbi:uncharacterized protein LOC131682851 [Topomyia yanbarensis]|uniref:uncharacterized protein LOC131682826 n=1 Tax=Topomyia yanbarensis TaxID=2498891 RepID=UPI00273C0B7A|nr:uncharacterized protein LOC131682826 [Topomyia yanbarensis]XP_058820604.1 uncharacterized protein LOC131682851 [Topomyia yanbarensis]